MQGVFALAKAFIRHYKICYDRIAYTQLDEID